MLLAQTCHGPKPFGPTKTEYGIFVESPAAVVIRDNEVFNNNFNFDITSQSGGEIRHNEARDGFSGFVLQNGPEPRLQVFLRG